MPCRAAWSSLQDSLCRPSTIYRWMGSLSCSLSLVSLPLLPFPFFKTVVTWFQSSRSVEVIPSWWTFLSILCTEVSSLVPPFSDQWRVCLLACFSCSNLLSDCLLSVACKWMGLYGRQVIWLISCDLQSLQNRTKMYFFEVFNGKHFVLASTHRVLKSLVLEPPEPHAGAFQPFHSLSGFNSCSSWVLGEIWLFCFPLVKDGELVAPIALSVDPSAGEMMQRWKVTRLFMFLSVKH